MKWSATSKLYDVQLAITMVLIAINAIMFLVCLQSGGGPTIPAHVLIANGALKATSVQPGHYWNLIAYGFLHTNAIQLGMSVLSLLICGPFLERRLGPSTFLIVYLTALIGSGLASIFAHASPFATVGASGGISGIIGALFALWILGAKDLSASFFLINFSVTFAFAARNPNLDPSVHIGGFVTGMVCIALLDLIAKANTYWLRCKFPEFVKFNILIITMVSGVSIYLDPPNFLMDSGSPLEEAGVWLLASIALIKVMDIMLASRHGLVGVVLSFASLNSFAAYVLSADLNTRFSRYRCVTTHRAAWLSDIFDLTCRDLTTVAYALSFCVFVLTLVFYIYPLQRGLRDVGFVGATFTAERRRHRVRGAV